MKESRRVLASLIAALVIGAWIASSGPPALMSAADLIAPIGTMWVNAIRMTVIPLLVALLITGVASAADVKTVGRLGGRSFLVFIGLLTATALVVIPILPTIFSLLPRGGMRPPLPPGAAEAAEQLSSSGQSQDVASWIVSLIPSNPIGAAATGAIVPLVIFGLLLALAIARTSPTSRATLLGFFKALGEAMLVLVRWVVAAAPIGVFALVLPLAAHTGAGLAGAVGFYAAVYAGTALAVTLLLYPVVAIIGRVPIRRFSRAVLPAQLIAASSSSSMAALPALVEGAEQGLGLTSRITGFVLPLAASTFRIAAPVSWTVGALFVAWFYGLELHARELSIIGVAAIFLPFVGPVVPRGAFLMLKPLFLTIGLPAEGIGILIAVDAIPDVFSTILNVTGDLAAASLVARADQSEEPVAAALEPTAAGGMKALS
jgi:Na+/H+-dicarboxylate symporter